MTEKNKNKKVLIVEDDVDVRTPLKDILELENLTVIVASHGQEGLELLEKNPDVEIILLDLMMPVMDGWSFLDKLRENDMWSKIPVIVISASGTGNKPLQASAVLRKPLDLNFLLETIQRLSE